MHRRNPENDPLEFSIDVENLEYIPIPDNFDYNGVPMFQLDKDEEDEYGLAPDDYAFVVLKKILHDGYIRTGWSYRNYTPTIYGPKSAVCFTEMPLYGLIEYAKSRANEYVTESYGIALLKEELFKAGARPVIYGLSTKHEEASGDDPNFGKGFRALSTKAGLGIKEQYRYVYTNLDSSKRTDWTHEREWRWADLSERFDFPGLPIFALNDLIHFSQIIVFVKTVKERDNLIDHLKNLFHSKMTNRGLEYNLRAIENTYVLSLDELADLKKDISLIKFDDLPLKSIPKIQKIDVKPETLDRVRRAIEEASKVSLKASTDFYDNYPMVNEKGEKLGPCGFSHVVTWESNSEITQALVELDVASSYADGYYHIYGLKTYPSQLLDVEEQGMIAASEYLTKELGQKFSYHSRLD